MAGQVIEGRCTYTGEEHAVEWLVDSQEGRLLALAFQQGRLGFCKGHSKKGDYSVVPVPSLVEAQVGS